MPISNIINDKNLINNQKIYANSNNKVSQVKIMNDSL